MKHRLPQRCGQVRTVLATLHVGLFFTKKAYKLNVTSSNIHLPKSLKPQLLHHRLVTSSAVVEVEMLLSVIVHLMSLHYVTLVSALGELSLLGAY